RIRPKNSREMIDMCRTCTTVALGEPQIFLGSDRTFTYDHVFDVDSTQGEIYSTCVDRLVRNALQGYNATVLAYGQTGSGKTYTMGTGFDHETETSEFNSLGVVPRAVRQIFSGIEELRGSTSENSTGGRPEFSLAVQYIELYHEDIYDLLNPFNKSDSFKIHEDSDGQITISGTSIKPIYEEKDALRWVVLMLISDTKILMFYLYRYLQQGALARTTASTKMNNTSSRSHAMFTIFIRRQRLLSSSNNGGLDNDMETLTSKFHFVDLAGSERLKRTMAEGERAREGISINTGLLGLGNCISALGDKRTMHVPYRTTKLTRLLQDSLGGNSQTLMIACVAPTDRDFRETLSTLEYANRAKNIQNKIKLNKDQSSRTISHLRREIATLQRELIEYKQVIIVVLSLMKLIKNKIQFKGKLVVDCEGNTTVSDTYNENTLLLSDNKRLQQRLKAMQETVNVLTEKNAELKLQVASQKWKTDDNSECEITDIVGKYISEIANLEAKLIESDEMNRQTEKAAIRAAGGKNPGFDENLITETKKDLEKKKEYLMSLSVPGMENQSYEAEQTFNIEGCEGISEGTTLSIINRDIECKTKLINELERARGAMEQMRTNFEDKVLQLNYKIANAEKERDDVLLNLSPITNTKDDLKKIKMTYEMKISDMQKKLSTLQEAQREHLRQQRDKQAKETQISLLRNELGALKTAKVQLMKKITEQNNRHKVEDSRKTKEIAQLLKEQRRQKNAVQSLEAKVSQKDNILKRKTEEVIALRKSQRSKSEQRRIPPVRLQNTSLNSRLYRQSWENLYHYLVAAARNRQMITQLEIELERKITERESLSCELNTLKSNSTRFDDLKEIDSIQANIDYIQEGIDHVQKAIMDFEDSKKEDSIRSDFNKIQSILDSIESMDEAKYVLQKISKNSVTLMCSLSNAESQLQEHKSLLSAVQQDCNIQQQMLGHLLPYDKNEQISAMIESFKSMDVANSMYSSQKSLESNATYVIPHEDRLEDSTYVELRDKSPSPV
ncbi:hypothetical protein KR026_012493, partial [Drosophila bipectinata]